MGIQVIDSRKLILAGVVKKYAISYLLGFFLLPGWLFSFSFIPSLFPLTRGTFRQVPTRRTRLSFVEGAYSDLRDIYIYIFFFFS